MKPLYLWLVLGIAALAGVCAHPEPARVAVEASAGPIPASVLDALYYEPDPHAGIELGLGEMPDDEVHRPLRERREGE
jgi:hypothetical protein